MIAIVDYGAGNLRSVRNAFEAIGQPVIVTREPADLAEAEGIVLPGVGAFGEGMAGLRGAGLVEPLTDEVMVKGKPFLGICLGLQLLAKAGLEHGRHEGLGWLEGETVRLEPEDGSCRVPHIGWNDVAVIEERESPLFRDLPDGPVFYFVHSYQMVPAGADRGALLATCRHGQTVTAAVQKGNIAAVQFHPEKSQRSGLQVLRNWVATLRRAGC